MPRSPRPTRRSGATAITAALAVAVVLLAGAPRAHAQPDPAYWRLADIEAQLAAWQAAHPDLVHVDVLGFSGQGRPIPLVKISDHAAEREAEPRLFFHGAQHANEGLGTGAIMRQIAALLDGHGDDPAVTARVDGLELFFAPVINPDGHAYVFGPNPHWADWRKTLRDNDGDGAPGLPRRRRGHQPQLGLVVVRVRRRGRPRQPEVQGPVPVLRARGGGRPRLGAGPAPPAGPGLPLPGGPSPGPTTSSGPG